MKYDISHHKNHRTLCINLFVVIVNGFAAAALKNESLVKAGEKQDGND
jgi:hypothetical protein